MKWNWQKKDWPKFCWDKARLAVAEESLSLHCGMLRELQFPLIETFGHPIHPF
jgi:hypothetical protein